MPDAVPIPAPIRWSASAVKRASPGWRSWFEQPPLRTRVPDWVVASSRMRKRSIATVRWTRRTGSSPVASRATLRIRASKASRRPSSVTRGSVTGASS